MLDIHHRPRKRDASETGVRRCIGFVLSKNLSPVCVYGRKCHFYFHLHFFTEQRDRSMCETIERAERGTRDVQVDVQRQQGRRRVVAVDAVIAKRHHVNKREIDVVMKKGPS